MVPIETHPGQTPRLATEVLADALNRLTAIGGFPITLVSLEMTDAGEFDLLDATIDAGGGTLFFTFDCSRPLSECLADFDQFARNQLGLHGEAPAAKAAGNAQGD